MSKPVFIVGPSRSGTAMVRSILNRSEQIAIAGETHYFDDLRLRLKHFATSSLDGESRGDCIDYFRALSHRPYGHGGDPEMGELSVDALTNHAVKLGSSGDAFFEAFCRIAMPEKANAVVWGEKTPRHAFRINEILSAYPEARIVCLVRDPRGVVASYRDWENQGGFDFEADPGHIKALEEESKRTKSSYSPLIISLLWRGAVNAAVAALRDHGSSKVRIERYESFVLEPEASTQALCEWLELQYSDELINIPILNSSYSQFSEGAGVSTGPANRWRDVLDCDEIAVIESACHKLMQKFEYERHSSGRFALRTCVEWGRLPAVAVRAAWVNRDRQVSLLKYILKRIRNL